MIGPTTRQLLRRACSLRSLAMRRAVWQEAFDQQSDDALLDTLEELLGACGRGDGQAADTLLALASWIMRLRLDEDTTRIAALSELAHSQERALTKLWLADPPAHKAIAPKGRLPDHAPPHEPRRWMVRCLHFECFENDRAMVPYRRPMPHHFAEMVARSDSPFHLGRQLDHQRLSPRQILLVIARRPTVPALLWEVLRRDAWLAQPAVRRSFIQNPFAPTGQVLLLLPTTPTAWRLLTRGAVHDDVYSLAQALNDAALESVGELPVTEPSETRA